MNVNNGISPLGCVRNKCLEHPPKVNGRRKETTILPETGHSKRKLNLKIDWRLERAEKKLSLSLSLSYAVDDVVNRRMISSCAC
jgi:hypothetical protein